MIPAYVIIALALFAFGFAWKALQFARDISHFGFTIPKHAPSPFPPKTRNWKEAISITVVYPYALWRRGNPWMFFGHVLYHIGFFLGIGSYFIVALASYGQLRTLPLPEALIRICTWTEYPELWPGDFLRPVFLGALVLACIGMITPLLLSALKKRGIIRPQYESFAENFTPIARDPHWTFLRVQRKAIAIIVLVMDGAMIFSCCEATSWLTHVHLVLFWTIIALFPYTFLVHEIWRVAELIRFIRIKRGIAA